MTNEEFVLRETNRERRNTGVFHKKGGSKSRKCSLPHDNLTPSQLNKLNGPVLSLHLDKPMTKKEWISLRDDQKKLYIEHLIKTYQANDKMIAEAVGCSINHICKFRNANGIKSAGRGRAAAYLGEEAQAAWLKFMHSEAPQEESEAPVEEETVAVSESEAPVTPTPVQVFLGGAQATRIEQTDFAITVSGVSNWSEMQDYFNLLPIRAGGSATVRIELHQGK